MKTLILNGSPRPNGDTVSLLKVLTQELDGEYITVSCYSADISPCTDCRVCRKAPRCAIQDGMQRVYDAIRDCDNVVIASPVYFSELTGRLLEVCSRFQVYFSSRFFLHKQPDIKPKRGAVILVGGGNGPADRAYDTAVCILRSIGAKDIYPMVCSHNTDNIPARDDPGAIEGVKAAARFLGNTDK